jgi:mevalonate kinase
MKAVAEAPSKVIITGEHFVVHGAWALAAAVGRKVRVEVQDSDRFRVVSDRFDGVSSQALLPIESVVESMAREFSFKPHLYVSISSEVPNGSGLGSSAATMVALTSAVSRLCSLGLGTREVITFSMVGERKIHGWPSGIDAATCAYGGVLLYRPGSAPKKLSFDGERRLLVVFSGRTKSTKRLIRRVADTRKRLPGFFRGLTDSAGEVSSLAGECLVAGDVKVLGRLLTFNHAVLSTVGASNAGLDGMVDYLLSLGCYGAKLTGAGGGGSVVAVAPEGKEKSIVSELKGRGLEAFVAVIPVEGVKSWLE